MMLLNNIGIVVDQFMICVIPLTTKRVVSYEHAVLVQYGLLIAESVSTAYDEIARGDG